MPNSISSDSMNSDDDSITAAVRDLHDISPEDETIVVESTSDKLVDSLEITKHGPGHPLKPKEVPLSLNVSISYTLVMFSYLEMKKPKARRSGEPVIIKLSNDKPLIPSRPKYSKTSGDSDASQGTNSDSDGNTRKKKRKKKKKKDPSELPLNVKFAAQMKLLQNQYMCNKPGCLSSGYCYILPDNNTHFTLSHQHLSVWAAALAAKPPITTIEKPPNHKEFDGLSSNLLSDTALLIQHRLAERNSTQSAPSASNAPTINFNVPNDFFSFLQPAATPNPPLPAAPADHIANTIDIPLLSISARPGPDLSLADFCVTFELLQEILTKLADNGYMET
ncbi:hypothetical protein DFH29DRAFT_1009282 [Suillus ampliporus]|nr:hypothetical protein DFH29DRAFT_1009282 [Suillus ampliporus]